MFVWLAVGAALADEPGFDASFARFGRVLAGAVDDRGQVDYGVIAARRAELDGFLVDVAAAPVATLSRAEKTALWLNAYNAITLRVILDGGVPRSIQDLDGGKVWTTRRFTVGGETLTLDAIENQRLRPLGDPRFHAALVCAAKGCPPLSPRPFAASDLDAALDAAARRWVATTAYSADRAAGTVALSMIFDWYGEDFVAGRKGDLTKVDGDAEAALWFLSRYAPVEDAAWLVSGRVATTWKVYDWSLNRR